jgi:two-component system OmpR family sensor kinase
VTRQHATVGLAALLPMVLGLLAGVLIERGVLPNQMLAGTYAIDAAAILSYSGVLMSLVAGALLAAVWWVQRRVEQAHAEERAAQGDARRRFLRRLDHELKNPLQIIRLGIVNLQHSAHVTPEQATSLERVGQQVQRLQRLVVDLRWLAVLVERGLDRSPVDLQEVLEEVTLLVDAVPDYGPRSVELAIQQVPWPVASVWGDRDLLMVVFRNLLDNALKYTAPGDQVEVRASDDGHTAVVEVADSGPGIPTEDIPHIFEELYRGANAGSAGGSGLGLALVRRIVALHGGSISVRSRVGQGTVMTVRLPLAPEGG